MSEKSQPYQPQSGESVALFLIFFCVALMGAFLLACIYWSFQ